MSYLRDYTKIPFQSLVVSFTILPLIALAYFYPSLPDRVPVFMKLNGEVDPSHMYGGFFYFNSADTAMFSNKYLFNFANWWVWVFLACIVASPLLVFLPG